MDNRSSVAAFAAVQDPAGRSSSVSPDGVAVSRGVVVKALFLQLLTPSLGGTRGYHVDLPQGSNEPSKVEANQMIVSSPPLEFDRHR